MYKKILMPLDGSRLSECSIEHVKAIAKGCQVQNVIILTVIEELHTYDLYFSFDDESIGSIKEAQEIVEQREKLLEQERGKAEDYLEKIASDLKEEGIAAQSVVIKSDKRNGAAEEILKYVRENKIDLVVMSSHGRSGVSRWAFGSVTDKVIRETKMPVLTVVPSGARSP